MNSTRSAEERLALVLRVVLARHRLRDLQQTCAAQLEPATLEARDDLACQPALHAVGLDEDECGLAGHAAGESISLGRPARRRREILERRQGRRDVRRAVRADLPERLERLSARRARRLQPRRTDGTDEIRGLDAGTTDGAALIELPEPLFHGLDLELALARVLDVLGRPEEHVDDRPEERWEKADDRRQRHEPRVLDPAARVLERPVGGREPEDDDEADAEVSEKGPVGILERQRKRRHGDGHSRSLPIP